MNIYTSRCLFCLLIDLQMTDFPEDLCPTVLGLTTNHISAIDLHVHLLIQGKSFPRTTKVETLL